MTYRDNARDLTGEVESLAERVAKLEEKPAKEPSKPWTNRQLSLLLLSFSVGFSILAGLAPSLRSGTWPLSIGSGMAVLICAIASISYHRNEG